MIVDFFRRVYHPAHPNSGLRGNPSAYCCSIKGRHVHPNHPHRPEREHVEQLCRWVRKSMVSHSNLQVPCSVFTCFFWDFFVR